jgi:putative ATP-dependent endonuclease of OLD family
MKIKSIQIENFRSIKKEEIIFPDNNILVLVGPNNAGKSNILKAVNNVLGESWFSGERAEINDFYQKDKSNAIKINIVFDNNRKFKFDTSEDWPIYYDEHGGKIFSGSTRVKEDFPCTYLEATRSIEKSFQFKSWELMGKVAKTFNEKARGKQEELKAKFDDVMDILDEVDGFKQFKDDFVSFFNEMQSNSPYRLKVAFKAFTPLNYFKSINILANDATINDNYDIDLIELGEGNKNLIIFALLRSYAKNLKKEAQGILAIEEPEIYLHPQARRHLFNIFQEIVKDSNIQIIYTTHSSDFIATENFYCIGLTSKDPISGTKAKIVQKKDLVKFCKDTGVPNEKTNEENIGEFYATTSNPRLNDAFFARKLILVEGETEEMCLPILFKLLDVDCDSQGISIIAVNGKNQIPKYWRLFKSFGLETYVLFDNDNVGSDKESSNKNLASCFNCTTEELLDQVSIIKVLETEKENVFSQKLFIVEEDFEKAFKKDFLSFCQNNAITNGNSIYDNLLLEAKELIKPIRNSQKGQIARYVVRKIITNYPDYKPSFISTIKENINITNIAEIFEEENIVEEQTVVPEEIAPDDIPF